MKEIAGRHLGPKQIQTNKKKDTAMTSQNDTVTDWTNMDFTELQLLQNWFVCFVFLNKKTDVIMTSF